MEKLVLRTEERRGVVVEKELLVALVDRIDAVLLLLLRSGVGG